jgi:carboxyl-terminal processing protease
VKREIVRVDSVLGDTRNGDDSWHWLLDDEKKIGYIRITSFSRHTAEDLRTAVRQLTDSGLRGLIIDLRFNPGGLLTSAIDICDMFIEEGVIVSTKGRNTPENPRYAKKAGTFADFPMAILVAPAKSCRPACRITIGPSSSASARGARGACKTSSTWKKVRVHSS